MMSECAVLLDLDGREPLQLCKRRRRLAMSFMKQVFTPLQKSRRIGPSSVPLKQCFERKHTNIVLRPLILLFLIAVLGCSHQAMHNSACASMNATVEVKPSADLSAMFGNDAIQAAINTMRGSLAKQADTSLSGLTGSGKDAAVSTARANGKNPTAPDMAALDAYLRSEVAPIIKQNPNCHVTVVPVDRAYVAIHTVSIDGIGDKRLPHVSVKNIGQAEAKCRLIIKQILNGVEHSSGAIDLTLRPDQSRDLFLGHSYLPTSDVESGKHSLTIAVKVSYVAETGGLPLSYEETWQYDRTARQFFLAHRQ